MLYLGLVLLSHFCAGRDYIRDCTVFFARGLLHTCQKRLFKLNTCVASIPGSKSVSLRLPCMADGMFDFPLPPEFAKCTTSQYNHKGVTLTAERVIDNAGECGLHRSNMQQLLTQFLHGMLTCVDTRHVSLCLQSILHEK